MRTHALPCRAYALANATLTNRRALYALAERLPSIMRWHGEEAESLQGASSVSLEPLFHDLAVHDVVDVNTGKGRFLLRRRDALKLTGVLSPIGIVDGHPIALRDEELARVTHIESGEVGGERLLQCLAALFGSGEPSDMADVVRGAKFVDDIHVSFVPDLLFPAQNDLFVLFSGNGFFLLIFRMGRWSTNSNLRPPPAAQRLALQPRAATERNRSRLHCVRCGLLQPASSWMPLRRVTLPLQPWRGFSYFNTIGK